MADEDETQGAATILAMHAMVSWLVKRELEREPDAASDLTRHVTEAMLGVTQLDPALASAAHAARGVVAQAIGERPMFVRLDS